MHNPKQIFILYTKEPSEKDKQRQETMARAAIEIAIGTIPEMVDADVPGYARSYAIRTPGAKGDGVERYAIVDGTVPPMKVGSEYDKYLV